MNFIQNKGSAKIIKELNLRKGQPSTQGAVVREAKPGEILVFVGWVTDGQSVSGNSKWFQAEDGNYFWSGNVEVITEPIVPAQQEHHPITASQFCSIIKTLNLNKANEQIDSLNKAMQEFLINTPLRQAAFIAQIAHESCGCSVFIENLNYSADGLIRVWPNRFNKEKAASYARQPQKIANCVYANRMGNGDESSGDGRHYRGRGVIQITGKNNYKACGVGLKLDLESSPELLELLPNAFRSGAWYWNSRNLNPLADKGDLVAVTKAINGGLNGLNERTQYYNLAKNILTKIT